MRVPSFPSIIDGLRRDRRTAWRRIRRTPLFAGLAVLSLALGFGLPAAVYSIVQTMLWRPLGVPMPEHLYFIASSDATSAPRWLGSLTVDDYRFLRSRTTSLTPLAASAGQVLGLTPGDGGQPDVVVETVSSNYFAVAGVIPEQGRLSWSTLSGSRAGDGRTYCVVSYRHWRGSHERGASVLGSTVQFHGKSCEVIGVAPESFTGFSPLGAKPTGVWVILPDDDLAGTPASVRVTAFGRAREGSSTAQARAELEVVASQRAAESPQAPPLQPVAQRITWIPVQGTTIRAISGSVSAYTYLILGLLGLVALAACANLANLVIARASRFAHELEMKRVLGASGAAVVREQVVESLFLATAGAAGGLAVCKIVLAFLSMDLRVSPQYVMRLDPTITSGTILFLLCGCAVAVVLCGVLPAVHLLRRAGSSPVATDRITEQTSRQVQLIRWQVALSVCLFLAATASIASVLGAASHRSGVEIDSLAVVTTQPAGSATGVAQRARRAVEDFETQAGVVGAAASDGLPFGVNSPRGLLTAVIEGRPGRSSSHLVLSATPRIFETLGVRLLRGRFPAWKDDEASAVISRSAAIDLFGTPDVIGREIWCCTERLEQRRPISAVVDDTDTGRFGSRDGGIAYLSLRDPVRGRIVFVLRSAGDPARVAELASRLFTSGRKDFEVDLAGSASLVLTGPLGLIRLSAYLLSALVGVALFISMMGLYGVSSISATQRRREVGIRLAMGASARGVRNLFLRQGLTPVVEGLAIGLGVGLTARAFLRYLVGDAVAIVEPISIGAAVALFAGCGFLASLGPAIQTARVNPNAILQEP